ncbi:protein NipSnap homolog 3A-like [Stegodyphus dumicola]|uniref:protein NipSnap homolog 3A-like n=1 Tax=Stegodyphus dumicola TaxID=202533 RepID=UPI0015B36E7E|nr:protein NipSnap homolog 3A-like [Stegodyphus dumicola]
MASTFYKGLFGILYRGQSNAAFKSLFNFKRTLSIPPSRDAEIDGLYFDSNKSQKIYEIRTYTIHPKDYKEYMKFTEDNFHLRFKHSKLFGFWSTEFNALNEIVHIWEYDNHDHCAKVRQDLSADTEWQSNYVNKVVPMLISETNATTMLLPWSIITLPCRPGVYELQIFNMNSHTDIWDGRLKAAMELSSLKLKSFNSVLIGCFISVFDSQNTVHALWQHESFDKFPFGCLKLLNETNLSVLHAFYREVRTGYSKCLLPHKASPLQ